MEPQKHVAKQGAARTPHQTPVTLTEFGDYECPFCGQAYPIIKELQESLGRRLIFEFKNFPLTELHPHALMAAEAAEAARAQGKFLQMHDSLYENQKNLSPQTIAEIAGEIELDLERFSKEWSDHVYLPRIRRDVEEGMSKGVQGTPSFFVDGESFDEPWTFDGLRAALEAKLRLAPSEAKL